MLPYLDADLLNRLLPFPQAISALRNALQDGPPAVTSPPRTTAEARGGHVLIMPVADRELFGVKKTPADGTDPPDRQFTFGLELILDGVAAVITRSAG